VHVAIVLNGNFVKLYINNNLENQALVNVGNIAPGEIELFGGRAPGPSDLFSGRMDEVGIWDRALSLNEIDQLYNNGAGLPYSAFGTSPPTTPLPPILSPIGNQSVQENQTLTILLNATDPNVGENLTFLTNAQTVLPSPSFLSSTSGLFTWAPTYNDQGFYNVTFYVTDGQFFDSETVNIFVEDVSFATLSAPPTAQLGSIITLNLHSPEDPNKRYLFAGSFDSQPGMSLPNGRVIPLNNDWLFNALLFVPQLFGFYDTTGNLDNNGNAPVTWNVPNIPGASGTNLKFSFITFEYDSQSHLIINSIAPVINITLQE